jgi:hypothetical protein
VSLQTGSVDADGLARTTDGKLYVKVTGDAAITGGTITGVSGVAVVLSSSGIPFIHLSSGSVSAVGAISAITALPTAYPHAYCYFPANALATSIVAGWHYCTFSNTTAGTAFLNTYTSGTPAIPTSPTAVTDGKGAFTGDTTERAGPTITVTGGTLGANGTLRSRTMWGHTNSAGTKTNRVRYSGAAGTQYLNQGVSTSVRSVMDVEIHNAGATGAQFGWSVGVNSTPANLTLAASTSTVDTSADTTVVFTVNKAVATDNHVLEAYTLERLSN